MGAIMSGASGYLLKEIGAQGILDAITRISEGQRLLDPTVTAKVLERVRHGDEEDRGWAELSERERQILELISEGQTNKEIAERYTLATRRKRTT